MGASICMRVFATSIGKMMPLETVVYQHVYTQQQLR